MKSEVLSSCDLWDCELLSGRKCWDWGPLMGVDVPSSLGDSRLTSWSENFLMSTLLHSSPIMAGEKANKHIPG